MEIVYALKDIKRNEIACVTPGKVFLSESEAKRAFKDLELANNPDVLKNFRIVKYKLVEVIE